MTTAEKFNLSEKVCSRSNTTHTQHFHIESVKVFIEKTIEIILMDISNCEKADRFRILAGEKLT